MEKVLIIIYILLISNISFNEKMHRVYKCIKEVYIKKRAIQYDPGLYESIQSNGFVNHK